jgi:DNA-binding CsgD family transcriptional regulator
MVSDRIHELTQRERECLRLVSRDRSSKQIGLELGISPHTVDVRLKRAIRLLGVTTRFDAARLLAQTETETGPEREPHATSRTVATVATIDAEVEAAPEVRLEVGFDAGLAGPTSPPGYSPRYPAAYQPLVSQPEALPPAPPGVVEGPRRSDEAGPRWRLPFLRQGRRTNDLTPAQRLFWIFAGAVMILVAFANFANALDVLQSMIRGLVR